jgi:hypothetical protein
VGKKKEKEKTSTDSLLRCDEMQIPQSTPNLNIHRHSQNFRSDNKSTISDEWNKTESVAPQSPNICQIYHSPSWTLHLSLLLIFLQKLYLKFKSYHIINTSITLSQTDWAVSQKYIVNVVAEASRISSHFLVFWLSNFMDNKNTSTTVESFTFHTNCTVTGTKEQRILPLHVWNYFTSYYPK